MNTTTPSGAESPANPRRPHPLDLTERVEGAQGFLFIFLTLVGTGFFLAFTEQGLDIVKSLAGDAHDRAATPRLAWLCATTTLLGFQGWFWARYCVEQQRGHRGRWGANPLLIWGPRLFAAIPFVFLFIAYVRAERGMPRGADKSTLTAWILLGLGALLLALLIFRDDLTQKLRRRAANASAAGRRREANAIDALMTNAKTWLFVAGLVIAAVFMVVFCLDPVTVAQVLGSCAVVLLAVALIIPVMATLIQLGRKVGVRTTESLIVLALILSSFVDNHAVRLTAKVPSGNRQTVPQAYADWRVQAAPGADGTRPIIFVASAGGASRSGFWTGEVLSQLEAMSGGQFSRHTFAISSVSGGSLGAVGFLATRGDHGPQDQLALRTGDFTGRDYLSPVLAGMLFPDLLQRFLPIAFLPDRAKALEVGWEAGWRKHCSPTGDNAAAGPSCEDQNLAERDFLSDWRGASGWSPVLMINGVHEETGEPILTSTVRFRGQGPSFIDAEDFHDLTGRDVRVSTAIANGARFPFISPGGTYPGNGKDSLGGHVVDGAYFDAAGVETIRQLATNLFADIPTAPADRLQPIYLIIANGEPSLGPSKPANIAPDAFGPMRGLYAARGAHGDLLATYLNENPPKAPGGAPAYVGPTGGPCSLTAKPLPANVVLICLCKPGAPMDWALSQWAQKFMRSQIGDATNDPCGNYAKLTALAQHLHGGS
jgi:hypothetical protein